MTERLQKVLARAGVAARRPAEALILAGRVRVKGRVVRELGTRVDPHRDRVEVDGRRIVEQRRIYIVLHKPRGVVCTMSDPAGRRTVASLVRDVPGRLFPVGRLDYGTSGVLVMTNDGDLAATLSHPRYKAEKVYVAKVHGVVDEEALERWRRSIVIDGSPTRPVGVRVLRVEQDKTWLELALKEGKNRQIRRLGDAAGFRVMRLARTRFSGLDVSDLAPGQYRHLTAEELAGLKKLHVQAPRSSPFAADPHGPKRSRGSEQETKRERRSNALDQRIDRARAAKKGARKNRSNALGQRIERDRGAKKGARNNRKSG